MNTEDKVETEQETIEELSRTSLGGRGINIGGNTVTQATEHLPEDQRLLIRWLHDHSKRTEMEWEALVSAVNYSSTTWYRIFTDKYRYPKQERKDGKMVSHPKAGQRMPVDEHCKVIARYKRMIDQRAAVHVAGFAENSVWKKVEWVCRRSFVRQKIGFIYGESQIGKTVCLREYERRNNHGQTYYVELPPAAGVQLMTRAIAKALHVNSGTCYEKLIEDVTDALDESKLLIVDEVHRVFTTYQRTSVMRCLDVLRYIHDQTRCGLVLCGTHVFRDQMKNGAFVQYLKQLRRRGLNEVQLPPVPTPEDLDLMARKFGLNPDLHDVFPVDYRDSRGRKQQTEYNSRDVMQQIARSDGFGKYIIRLQDAVAMATEKGDKPGWSHFVRAHHIIEAMAAMPEEADAASRS